MDEVYIFLEALRRTGITNMFGSIEYIMLFFPELEKKEARAKLFSWMDSVNTDYSPYEDKIKKYVDSINNLHKHGLI